MGWQKVKMREEGDVARSRQHSEHPTKFQRFSLAHSRAEVRENKGTRHLLF